VSTSPPVMSAPDALVRLGVVVVAVLAAVWLARRPWKRDRASESAPPPLPQRTSKRPTVIYRVPRRIVPGLPVDGEPLNDDEVCALAEVEVDSMSDVSEPDYSTGEAS